MAQLYKLFNAVVKHDFQEDEVWKEIEGTDGNYFVSNYGYVVSLYRNNPRVLKPFLCGDDGTQYHYVTICGKDLRVNRLVAQAFIPNTENKPIVHHKDHNKLNNHWSNLEWVTQKENIQAYIQFKSENNSE